MAIYEKNFEGVLPVRENFNFLFKRENLGMLQGWARRSIKIDGMPRPKGGRGDQYNFEFKTKNN